jgi:pimeloyl-ACP methyl ester carboxylesterase
MEMSETRFLDVPGGRIAYDLTGPVDGPLVVGVHGMGDTRGTFRLLTPLLVARGYRVAAMDCRGHGDSSTGWPTCSQQAGGDDLAALVRHLGGRAVLIGNSSGAGIAAFAAAAVPQQVSSLVLISTFATKAKLNPLLAAAQGLVLRSPALWAMYFGSLFKAGRPVDQPAYLKMLRGKLREPGRMAAVRGLVDPADRSWVEVASAITAPTLIVHGSKDPDYPDPEAEARVAQGLLPSADVAMIDGAGHYPQVELPEKTAAVLLDFLTVVRA